MDELPSIAGELRQMAGGANVKVKLGRGVVNNNTYALLGIVGALGMVSVSAILVGQVQLGFVALGGIGLFGLIYYFGTWIFASRNPKQAMLGGAEYLESLKLDLAGSGVRNIHSLPPIEAPPVVRQISGTAHE